MMGGRSDMKTVHWPRDLDHEAGQKNRPGLPERSFDVDMKKPVGSDDERAIPVTFRKGSGTDARQYAKPANGTYPDIECRGYSQFEV
jgi:hypothetical protein